MGKAKKLFLTLLFCLVFILVFFLIEAQVCSGSWATNRAVTAGCVSGQWIGEFNATEPAGCPTNPVYTLGQTNTFTFDNIVSGFVIDFISFDTNPGCGKMEIKINGIFYPLIITNLVDIPGSCAGLFSYITLTPDGYITGSATAAPSRTGHGRIIISDVNANSVSISTNDPFGTIVSNPFSCSVVPLKLESFIGYAATNCKTVLTWETGIESNVKNIEVLQSLDGINFKAMIEVMPKGSDSHYTVMTDNYTGTYFKLKINDLDGHYEYSKIIKVKSNCDNISYAVFPDPAQNSIEIEGLKKDDKLSVLDMLGRTVLHFNTIPNNNKFDIQQLATGMYCLRVINQGSVKANIKIIKE